MDTRYGFREISWYLFLRSRLRTERKVDSYIRQLWEKSVSREDLMGNWMGQEVVISLAGEFQRGWSLEWVNSSRRDTVLTWEIFPSVRMHFSKHWIDKYSFYFVCIDSNCSFFFFFLIILLYFDWNDFFSK